MFLMISAMPGRKDLEYDRVIICENCGAYGRYAVYMTYMCLALFFIPIFKWKKEFFVQTSCCGKVYALDPEIGQRIAHGEAVEILPEHLKSVNAASGGARRCPNCGYTTLEDFDFCPKCGNRFN